MSRTRCRSTIEVWALDCCVTWRHNGVLGQQSMRMLSTVVLVLSIVVVARVVIVSLLLVLHSVFLRTVLCDRSLVLVLLFDLKRETR
jgi:hypothetical protein